jgi:hypothetical protein
MELHGRWRRWAREELEAKRRRLRLAEATMELVQRRQEEEGEGAEGVLRVSSAAPQASVGYQMSP